MKRPPEVLREGRWTVPWARVAALPGSGSRHGSAAGRPWARGRPFLGEPSERQSRAPGQLPGTQQAPDIREAVLCDRWWASRNGHWAPSEKRHPAPGAAAGAGLMSPQQGPHRGTGSAATGHCSLGSQTWRTRPRPWAHGTPVSGPSRELDSAAGRLTRLVTWERCASRRLQRGTGPFTLSGKSVL